MQTFVLSTNAKHRSKRAKL